ncbi:MAG: hypothetical protein QXO24_03275 [Candidatus Micrarchaeaceae archaeon]
MKQKKKRNAGMQRKKENHLHIWRFVARDTRLYFYECIDCKAMRVFV